MHIWRAKGNSGHSGSWRQKSELKACRRPLRTRRSENLRNTEYNLPENTN